MIKHKVTYQVERIQAKKVVGIILSATLALSVASLAGCNLAVMQHLNNPHDPQSFNYQPTPAPLDYESPFIGTLKYVPAGQFQRSSNSSYISTQSAFRISAREITRGQYFAVLVDDPSYLATSPTADCPVQNVSWYQTILFCNKLSELEGLTPVYTIKGTTDANAWLPLPSSYPDTDWDAVTANWSADGYRLPTTDEWHWAAIGATHDTGAVWLGAVNSTGYNKAFSGYQPLPSPNAIGDYAWYSYNAGVIAHSCGSKAANELGIYDMSGNVLEWVWNWDEIAPGGALTDYRGPAPGGSQHALLGGSYNTLYLVLTIDSARSCDLPANDLGFRVVRN